MIALITLSLFHLIVHLSTFPSPSGPVLVRCPVNPRHLERVSMIVIIDINLVATIVIKLIKKDNQNYHHNAHQHQS